MKAGHTCDRHLHIEPGHHCSPCTRAQIQAPYVIIPFYERDLCKLVFTLNSIAKFDKHHNLGNIILMWVSHAPMHQYAGRIAHAIRRVARTRHVMVEDFSRQFNQVGSGGLPQPPGWIAQQSLKLKIAKWVPTEFYVVLDTKNTFGRLITKRTFFTACNQGIRQGRVPIQNLPWWHKQAYEQAAGMLGIPVPWGGHWPTSIGPVVMHTQTVLKMLEHLGESVPHSLHSLCSGPLCQGLWKKATEFTLYHLWAHSQANFHCIHAVHALPKFHEDWNRLILWRRDYVQERLKTLKHATKSTRLPVTFGAEANALLFLSPRQRRWAALHLQRLYRRAGLYHKPHSKRNLESFVHCAIVGRLYDNATAEMLRAGEPGQLEREQSLQRRMRLQVFVAFAAAVLISVASMGCFAAWRRRGGRKQIAEEATEVEMLTGAGPRCLRSCKVLPLEAQ